MKLKKLLLKHSAVPPVNINLTHLRVVFIMMLLGFIFSFAIQIPTLTAQSDLTIDERQTLIRDAIVRNQFMQATYHINILQTQATWSTTLAVQIGDIYAEIGDIATAVHYWETGEPTSASLERLADGYIDLQSWQLATETLTELVTIDSNNIWANYHLGVLEAIYGIAESNEHLTIAVDSPFYGESVTTLSEILTEPSSLIRNMRIGTLFTQQESWGFAEFAFLRASVTDYAYPEALAYQGWVRYQQGKNGANWIEQAVTLDPSNGQVLYIAGLEQRYLGNYYTSIDIFTEALVTIPDNPAVYAEIANTHRLLGNLPEAEYWYLVASTFAEEDNTQFQDLLTQFYEIEGSNLNQVNLESLLIMRERFPDNPEILASLGWSLYLAGDREDGILAIEDALALQPNHPRSLYYFGLIAHDEGLITLARQYFGRVIESASPFAILANQALAEIDIESE